VGNIRIIFYVGLSSNNQIPAKTVNKEKQYQRGAGAELKFGKLFQQRKLLVKRQYSASPPRLRHAGSYSNYQTNHSQPHRSPPGCDQKFRAFLRIPACFIIFHALIHKRINCCLLRYAIAARQWRRHFKHSARRSEPSRRRHRSASGASQPPLRARRSKLSRQPLAASCGKENSQLRAVPIVQNTSTSSGGAGGSHTAPASIIFRIRSHNAFRLAAPHIVALCAAEAHEFRLQIVAHFSAMQTLSQMRTQRCSILMNLLTHPANH